MSQRARRRLDALLVARGLTESRERARALILAGKVRVAGLAAPKPGSPVPDAVEIQVDAPDHPWVGRGGVKLAHALDVFRLDVRGRLALDIGASTGGFTDVLLHRGARHVIALDVGHGQLHWRLRNEPRVTVIEGVNARTVTPADVLVGGEVVDVITIDVSFISLRHILPAVPALLVPSGDVIALVKPQFEAGREQVGRGGLVTDPAVHALVIDAVTGAAAAIGFERVALTESPITGAEGNREFLVHWRMASPPGPSSSCA